MASIEDKIREARLRSFGHMRRRNMNAPVRICEKIDRPDYRWSRGRPRRVRAKLLDKI